MTAATQLRTWTRLCSGNGFGDQSLRGDALPLIVCFDSDVQLAGTTTDHAHARPRCFNDAPDVITTPSNDAPSLKALNGHLA